MDSAELGRLEAARATWPRCTCGRPIAPSEHRAGYDSCERCAGLEARRAQLAIDAEAQSRAIDHHVQELERIGRALESVRAELEGAP